MTWFTPRLIMPRALHNRSQQEHNTVGPGGATPYSCRPGGGEGRGFSATTTTTGPFPPELSVCGIFTDRRRSCGGTNGLELRHVGMGEM